MGEAMHDDPFEGKDPFEGMSELDWDLNRVLDRIPTENDHATVLVATGFLSELLRKLIEARLLSNSGATSLFGGPTAPLQSLSARSSLALAIGLINADEYRRITLMRRIRNAFAHEFNASFMDEAVATKCFLFDPKIKMPKTDGRYGSLRKRADAGKDEFVKHAMGLTLLLWIRLYDKKLKAIAPIVNEHPPQESTARKTKSLKQARNK